MKRKTPAVKQKQENLGMHPSRCCASANRAEFEWRCGVMMMSPKMILILRAARIVDSQPKAAENAGRQKQRQSPRNMGAADADMQTKAA